LNLSGCIVLISKLTKSDIWIPTLPKDVILVLETIKSDFEPYFIC
jgi:hypothetical protein